MSAAPSGPASQLLAHPFRRKILAKIVGSGTAPWTSPDLAKAVGASRTAASRALNDLYVRGVLDRRFVSGVFLYRLVESDAADSLRAILDART